MPEVGRLPIGLINAGSRTTAIPTTLCPSPSFKGLQCGLTIVRRFGLPAREHGKLRYNASLFLVALALAQGALFGYSTPEDLWEQEIPTGDNEMLLRVKDSHLGKPILRTVTMAAGITEKPLTVSSFSPIFRAMLEHAGYFGPVTIHSLRRGLMDKVDSKHSGRLLPSIVQLTDILRESN